MEKNTLFLDIETTGLIMHEHRITCIGCALNDEYYCFMEKHEENTLQLFFNFFIKSNKYIDRIVTKNGKMFDIPFIMFRYMYKLGHAPILTNLKYKEHFDIHLITKGWVKLDDICRILKIETKSSNGLEAIAMWHAKRLEELRKYNLQDVKILTEVYEKVK